MSNTHTRRALSVVLALAALGSLGACAGIRDYDHDHGDDRSDGRWQQDKRGRVWDPNGRRDVNDRDGRDRDRDGHDQDWR